jgi:Tfp pilus assembly protein PilN
MSQQINLLPPRARRDRYLLWVALLLGTGMLASGFWWNGLRLDAQALQARVDAQAREIADLQAQAAARNPATARSRGPEAEIEALSREAAGFKALLQEVRQGPLGRADGYSGLLTLLGRVPHPETWLTQIELGHRGDRFTLTGLGLSEPAIAQYAARVNREFEPLGLQLRSLELARQGGTPGADTGARGSAAAPISFKVH